MLMLILGIITGICLGVIGSVFYTMSKKEPKKEESQITKTYIRRGIWENDYSCQSDIGKESFTVQFELGELESTGTKSKVEVIRMSCKRSQFNNESTFTKIKSMVNETWMSSSEIEWIDDRSKERNSKIDNILNS
jgi:hypothetical protein